MNCYACDQEATQRCSRCGNPYCRDHGDDPSTGSPSETSESARRTGQAFCADCLDPASAAPSGTVFRASVFALLVASVLALWLIVRPPSLPGESSELLKPQASPSATTPSPGTSPRASASPSPGGSPAATPGASATPAPSHGATPAPAPIQYTVVQGDSLYGIADKFGVSAQALADANGLNLNDPILHPGDKLVIPQH